MRRSQKQPRIWDFEFSDFNSVSRTQNVTDTGILCLAVNEGSTEALQSLCSQTGTGTAHEAQLKAWDGAFLTPPFPVCSAYPNECLAFY